MFITFFGWLHANDMQPNLSDLESDSKLQEIFVIAGLRKKLVFHTLICDFCE